LLPLVLAISVVVELFSSAAAIGVGLGIGPRVNLGKLFLPDESTGQPSAARRFWITIGEPLALGVTLGAIVGAFAWNVDSAVAGREHTLTMPTPWEGLLGSIGAGIREEIWLRLGFMTFLVWLGAVLVRLLSQQKGEPPATVVWIANLLAALLFAAIHLPQTQAILGLSTGTLLLVFYGNGLPGLVFGWLYWRRGLVAAMLAHFGLDLVLKVFIPLLS
jgi:membrane protease YdiL (CAAX protease family)